jgi:hypothetical protein
VEVVDLVVEHEVVGQPEGRVETTLPAVVWTNEEWHAAVLQTLDLETALSPESGWSEELTRLGGEGINAGAVRRVLGTTLAAGFLRATRLPRMFPTPVTLLRAHLTWLVRHHDLDGQAGATALVQAEAFAFDIARLAGGVVQRGQDRRRGRRMFQRVPGFGSFAECPSGNMAAAFRDMAVACVGVRMAAALGMGGGPQRRAAAQAMYTAAQAALFQVARRGVIARWRRQNWWLPRSSYKRKLRLPTVSR